jgi:hypothetical protein
MSADSTTRPASETRKTWAQLQAEGVKRCCAMFNGGRQCSRRAVTDDGDGIISWCTKHGKVFTGVRARNDAAIEAERNYVPDHLRDDDES